MPTRIKKRSRKTGLPPGTLVHIGDKKTEQAKITLINYDETHLEEREAKSIEECFPPEDKATVTWVNVDGIHDLDIIGKVGARFALHPLTLEDIANTDQRPKMEDYGDYLFVVLKVLDYGEKAGKLEAEQVSIILGSNFVISLQERESAVFEPIKERIRNGGRIKKQGADYLAYSLMDAIVDSYFGVLERLGERIELLEEALVTNPRPETLKTLHHLKSEMIFLRKSVWPLREVIGALERGESPLIQESTGIYLRDVYDHTIQVIDAVETYRDMLSGMLDIYLSSISNRMNQIMKVLTIIATIFIPLTFIVGVYGMNFRYMPELEWAWGYPAVLLFMLGVVVLMLIYFRRNRWI